MPSVTEQGDDQASNQCDVICLRHRLAPGLDICAVEPVEESVCGLCLFCIGILRKLQIDLQRWRRNCPSGPGPARQGAHVLDQRIQALGAFNV